jgi:hypothetical protein
MQTIKQQAGNQRRRLKAIRARLEDMAADWGEVDLYFEGRLAEIAQDIEKLEGEMTGFTDEGGNDENQ